MNVHLGRIAAVALLPLLALAGAAGAQTPKPSPTPVPTPVAFSAHAHANATVVMPNGTFAGTVQLALAQRANLTRIDVLSVKSDSFPVPPISVTLVIDRGAHTITGWNDTTRQYHVQPLLPRPAGSATAGPNATPAQARRGTSPLAKLDVFEMTVKLTGHTMTLGLPTTGMAFDLQVQNRGDKARSHVTATTQLADEFAAFPMTLDVSVEPGSVPFSTKIGYAVDDLTRETPPAARFTVPAGYTESSSLTSLIFSRRSAASPSPSASPR